MKLMRDTALRVALVVVAVVGSTGTASAANKVTQASVEELQQWVAAVNAHVPGRGDQSADAMAHLSYKRREILNPAMTLFLAYLQIQRAQGKIATKTIEEAKAVDLARGVTRNPGLAVFIKRAAILHSDAAILTERIGGIDDRTEPPPRKPTYSSNTSGGVSLPLTAREENPPLLANSRFVASRDGEVIGQSSANWNWPFARSLLDLLVPTTAAAGVNGPCRGAECMGPIVRTGPQTLDPFAPAWYHAIAAYMLGTGLYAEATAHLDRGVEAFPNDPLILFDRACYSEVFGLPMQQVLRDDARGSTLRAIIPSETSTNANAESWFGRALAANPAFAEARVRMARLLDERGAPEAALREINTALSENPKGVVAFYAHLFAGRAAQALGRQDDARRQFGEAAAWFPDAQSAALGQSQAALSAADVPAALEPLHVLTARTRSIAPDPWWYYHLGAGRDLDDLLAALWASVPKRED